MAESPRVLSSLPVHPGAGPNPVGLHLLVDGLVTHSFTLCDADLVALPRAAIIDDFLCLEGWSVPGLHWEGVALNTVLEAVGVAVEARWVQASAGEFSVPLELGEAHRALLATHLGGAVLTVEHGGPLRLVVPGADCFANIKWLDHLELRATPTENTARRIALGRISR